MAKQGSTKVQEEANLCPPTQAEGMISEIRSAFEEALEELVWMDENTRQAAKEKVSHVWG
jgi:predicted metalloendopeptidase